ncbi:MAG: ribosome biogenesis GTPase Der, partial [Actinomycetota bacterium]
LPVVAVVGRPNVGKSSLVNRVLGRREAIVEPTPGVTRDRRSFVAEWAGRSFEIVDTGGLEPGAGGLEERVAEQAQVAIEAADVVVLVVDGRTGPLEDDLAVAELLRRSGKPALVAVNKADDPEDEPAATAFYRAGLGDPLPVSALHGRGSGDLLDAVVSRLPDRRTPAAEAWASFAIVGRPNVGKSSLLNALLGAERSLVDPRPGTTRDPVDAVLEAPGGRRLRIADTAGMRREVKVKHPIEYFSLLRARQTLRRVDAAVVVVDASEGVTGPDQRIAEEVLRTGRGCVLALNKWDLVTSDEQDRRRLERAIDERLRFLPWARRIRTAAVTGRGVDKLVPAILEAVGSHRRRLLTPVLNRLVQGAQERRPHPRVRGRAVRVLYAVQPEVAPPTVVLFTTGPLEESYLRYLEHRLRAAEPLDGSPMRIRVRVRARG